MQPFTIISVAALLLAACAPSTPPTAPEAAATRSPQAPAAPAPATPVDQCGRFVDIDWRVQSSSAVAPGTRYRFASDGSLYIDAAGSTPSVGRWTCTMGALVMTEEGIPYRTDILRLDASHFSIRSHNPGTPVDIVMVKDDSVEP